MKTEKMLAHGANTSPSSIDALLGGTIFASEFAGAAFDVRVTSESAVDAPQGTQTKTCKPTRNPCCRPGDEAPTGHRHDALDLLSV
ncbi:hypothetical protein [Sphingomonas alpina]|uniref:hypothetical protein n=1 Tax=Sphingomonas alpina TaxID=653931 RepID=UPI0021BB2CBF|nr:hypothetical protein [Sphingomonas alpina]